MSLSKALEGIEALQKAPEVGEISRAWMNAWYKAGWRDCLRMVQRQLISLAGEKHTPRRTGI